MRRTAILLLLVISMPFQSVAWAGQGLIGHLADGLAHAVLHLDREAHHHHEDGSVHEEQSEQSQRHLQADVALGAVALVAGELRLAFGAAHDSALPHTLPEAPPPVLDRPTRPPRIVR